MLGTPPDDAQVLRYRADLAAVRAFTAAAARQAGLLPRRATDFVLAVSELAANTLAHTKGPGTLIVWLTERELIGQVRDAGHITRPARDGTSRTQPETAATGYGWWASYATGCRSAPGRAAPSSRSACACGPPRSPDRARHGEHGWRRPRFAFRKDASPRRCRPPRYLGE